MRLVFAGTPAVAVPSLQALLESPHTVAAVLTRPDAAAGRGRRSRPSPVRQLAEAAGVEVLTPRRPSEPDFLDRLAELAPDCVPVVAYGAIVPRAALDVPRLGWVNLHFSLLPAWRGAAPVQHAILAGDTETGATVFELEEGLDTGPVLATMVESLGARESAGEVLDRLARSGAPLLTRVLDALAAGSLVARPQPAEGVSHAPKLTTADAEIDFAAAALHVDRRVRACTPQPGAWTTYAGRRLRLGPVEPLSTEAAGAAEADSAVVGLSPGELRVDREQVLVGTGSVPVRLGEVTPEGKRAMSAADWARGVRPSPGSRLGVRRDG